VIAILALAAGIFVYNKEATGRSSAGLACAADEYSCPCATGSYCLKRGAMCLAPTAACPR
ncbi:MAG TPA: hypothetical protein VFP46_01035, partial [Candidatus Paceibacterota bacterium]|nr:hypothetical protein [Candidatus Paceibacterota bacterium]